MLVAAMVLIVSLPKVPMSWRENRVFGDASASLIASIPLVPAVAKVRIGLLSERVSGALLESVNA